MCGIVGYIGKNQALPVLMEGLKKLEYRGYDSAGVCMLQNGSLTILKQKGKVEELDRLIREHKPKAHVGIGHTRWATHGVPNEINSHPHIDCTGSIAIVHNGIVENYTALKELLKKEGHEFVSETDSEVIAHLIEKFRGGNLEESVAKALKLIEGAYALAILDKNTDTIIATRKSSPLILGIGTGEFFVASDASAILHHTKNVIYLDDGEVAVLGNDSYVVKNVNGQVLDKEIHEVAMTVDQISKRGFKHFMLKEIFEQPESIENTLRGRIAGEKIKLSIDFDIRQIQRIIITACGTSWHSALIGKYIIEKLAKIPVEVDYASEFRYRNPIVRQSDLVVAISQSGETADTLAALKEVKLRGAKTLGIVNVVGSAIAREVDAGIYLHAGPEIGVASTKAFTCQVTALIIFALYLKQEKGESLDEEILGQLLRLPEIVKDTLSISDQVKKLAEDFKDYKNFLYLGRNLNFPVALEGALKLKEISYIHAEGYPAAEMKHGPIALIDENMPVVFICPKALNYETPLANHLFGLFSKFGSETQAQFGQSPNSPGLEEIRNNFQAGPQGKPENSIKFPETGDPAKPASLASCPSKFGKNPAKEFRNSEPKDEIYQKILSNMEEVKARGGNIIAIINEDDSAISKLAKHIIKVPKTSDILSPIINVIPLQLLAYHVADLKGLNVDRPRNLAKSVTVE